MMFTLNLKKDEFDYIVIDEVHKAGAYSYQKSWIILNLNSVWE